MEQTAATLNEGKKNILWVYFVYSDVSSHITTWREMYLQLSHVYNIHYILPLNKSKTGFTDTIHYVKLSRLFGARRISFAFLAFFKFLLLYKKLRPDYVMLDDWSFFYSLVRKFSKHKAVFIYDSRTPYYGQWRKHWQNSVLKYYIKQVLLYNKKHHDGLTCISNELKELYEKDFGFTLNPKFCEWPSGVNLEAFKASRYPKYDYCDNIKMVFHGSFTHTRGLENAIDGLQLLNLEYPNFVFHMYGQGHYIREIEDKINTHQLNDKVKIIAPVAYNEVPDMISKYDLAIMTYPQIDYWEGNVPLKLLEYIAMEKFVLCTDLKIFRRMGSNYPKMIFIKDNSPLSIKKGILQYRALHSALGNASFNSDDVIERYSWNTIANNFTLYLESFRK